MNLIVRQAKIVDAKSEFHNEIVDILIEGGTISKIGKSIKNSDNFEELKFENLCVSQGWFESSASFGEPGFEDRETIANGLSVAAKSGFTGVALQPNANPIIDNQALVNLVRTKSNGNAVDLYPIGALTMKSEGNDLAELLDMKNAGAVAFGDYARNMESANLLKLALQYAQDIDALVIAFAQESSLKGKGIANEGINATKLGLKGIPNLAEELMIARNLYLLEYAGGKLHIPTVSTPKSVQLIKEAKAKGLRVTCSVSVHHLTLTDEKLSGFDTRVKVSPPLRTESDRKALVKAVKDGIIDAITSDHNPIDIEHKKMEFDLAKDGTIGLESAFRALLNVLPIEIVVDKLTSAKAIFGIESSGISEKSKANLTFFTTDGTSVFTKQNILSKSKNSAFLGEKTKGKVYGIFNNSQLILS
ncbi:dihydroorotase [Flavobacterium sp.]|uniref:dihydroorotase n=1 Tax=Flavobacterium sp. TaxID=239 RepID=UPI00120AC51D|nr:dihydroorotase [Flavobacterium sp.]RZJ70355.1 MAG: dihydroorotase [Flavobacterium sp.]